MKKKSKFRTSKFNVQMLRRRFLPLRSFGSFALSAQSASTVAAVTSQLAPFRTAKAGVFDSREDCGGEDSVTSLESPASVSVVDAESADCELEDALDSESEYESASDSASAP